MFCILKIVILRFFWGRNYEFIQKGKFPATDLLNIFLSRYFNKSRQINSH